MGRDLRNSKIRSQTSPRLRFICDMNNCWLKEENYALLEENETLGIADAPGFENDQFTDAVVAAKVIEMAMATDITKPVVQLRLEETSKKAKFSSQKLLENDGIKRTSKPSIFDISSPQAKAGGSQSREQSQLFEAVSAILALMSSKLRLALLPGLDKVPVTLQENLLRGSISKMCSFQNLRHV